MLFSFVWDLTILGAKASPMSIIGSACVMGGVLCVATSKGGSAPPPPAPFVDAVEAGEEREGEEAEEGPEDEQGWAEVIVGGGPQAEGGGGVKEPLLLNGQGRGHSSEEGEDAADAAV